MFSGASSFAERLRAAAQAGVEQFDQARVHAPELHLPKITLPGTISSTSPLSPGGGGGVAADQANTKSLAAAGIASPRRSGELERTTSTGSAHSALSSRLNSLVSGAGKAKSPFGKPLLGTGVLGGAGATTISTTVTTPRQSDELASAVPQPRPGRVSGEAIDPTSVPLPPSPELAPFVLSDTSTPDFDSPALTPTTSATFNVSAAAGSDGGRGSSSGLSLFNTPRNPLPSSPSSALSVQRPSTPPPLPLPSPTIELTGSPDPDEAGDTDEPTAGSGKEAEAEGGKADEVIDDGGRDVVEADKEIVTEAGNGDNNVSKTDLNRELEALKTTAERANKILRDASPLLTDGIADTDALDSWVKMVSGKMTMGDSEMKRLGDKLALQESRIEELRETHRLESESSNKLVGSLREQLTKAETTLSSQASQLLQLASLQSELQAAQSKSQEEEEKRGKAVALLKTVRAKLVKLEREREQVDKRQEEDKSERQKLTAELDRLRGERERETQTLRQTHEKELAACKDKFEKEMLAKRREWELEMITTKATHAKDMAAKSKHINSLVESMQELNKEKRTQFEVLQARQEELETAIAAKEMHESRTRELQLQAQEALERAQIAEEALEEAQRAQYASAQPGPGGNALRGINSNININHSDTNSNSNSNSNDYPIPAEEVSRLLADASAKSEAKLTELKEQIAKLERERTESEEEQAQQLRLRAQEVERLRVSLNERQAEYAQAVKSKESGDAKVKVLESEMGALRAEVDELKAALRDSQTAQTQLGNGDDDLKRELELLHDQIRGLNVQLEEARQVHAQLRSTNRTLREEMRRIQSSAQLLERQRNPGLGYWSATNVASSGGHSGSHVGTPGRVTSPTTAGGMSSPAMSFRESADAQRSEAGTPTGNAAIPSSNPQDEEEVNLEYLRNVILQFLEHKEMRPNLVRVLSVILRFTPQETRRLNAKI